MRLVEWEELPVQMQSDEVKEYYMILRRRKGSLLLKRAFDVVVSFLLLVICSPVFVILAVAIKIDSKGPVFYRQERVTQYGKTFRIFKFRTMVQNADGGMHITVDNDTRITRVGKKIRKLRLDELGQLIDVLRGTMTFVGTRPEAVKYVEHYSKSMWATLLLPAGITSEASIKYKDEDKMLTSAADAENVYIHQILPQKMKYNLAAMRKFSLINDVKIMFQTVFTVLGKDFSEE
ncbi:MAG: sugar transferase [Lachnospiraceae bacterium]|nr:sugar transferase [Lachnospiraceae bacterium]MBP3595260.1 sugar transferase [Lachnospiraceae bacterium]